MQQMSYLKTRENLLVDNHLFNEEIDIVILSAICTYPVDDRNLRNPLLDAYCAVFWIENQ